MDIDLDGEWLGFRIRGRYLISPNGDRITAHRIAGILFRDQLELRRAGFASRRKAEANKRAKQYGAKVKVVVIDLADYRVHGLTVG